MKPTTHPPALPTCVTGAVMAILALWVTGAVIAILLVPPPGATFFAEDEPCQNAKRRIRRLAARSAHSYLGGE